MAFAGVKSYTDHLYIVLLKHTEKLFGDENEAAGCDSQLPQYKGKI